MSNNPLITDTTADTLANLSDYIDFMCVAASNDEDVPAGFSLSLGVVRSALIELKKRENEKQGK